MPLLPLLRALHIAATLLIAGACATLIAGGIWVERVRRRLVQQFAGGMA